MPRTTTPEEHELAEKRSELEELQGLLGDRELYLATLRAELSHFEGLYLRTVGARYAELDELKARIAEHLAERHSGQSLYREQAAQTRARARESAGAASAASPPTKPFAPSSELKSLYRQLAKHIHPDLATDEEDRARRDRLMKEANQAYGAGDEARLRRILNEWQASPDAVAGEGVGADLVRVIRKIDQVRRRLADIEREIQELKDGELFSLKTKVDAATQQRRDLLKEMIASVDLQVAAAQSRLAALGLE